MEEKDIIGSVLPNINIEKINVSNPSGEVLSIELRYSFYDSLKQQNTLWSSLPASFKQSVKIVVGILEDGPNLKQALYTFQDPTSSEQLKFFHSSIRGDIKSVDNFKKSVDQNNREDISVETINGVEYRKYVAQTKIDIDITNLKNLNFQAVAYCFFDSTEFDKIVAQESIKVGKYDKKIKKQAFFPKSLDYCGKFTYINIFTDNILKPEKLTILNSLTKEEFLGQVKAVSRNPIELFDFDTGIIPLEEYFISTDIVEDMRNYKFLKKNLKNVLNEINALSYKFKNVNNKLVTVTNQKQYFSQLFISKKLLEEEQLPLFDQTIYEQPEWIGRNLPERMIFAGTFFFDYERFIKEKSILNRIKQSTIFLDPRFVDFKIQILKKNFTKKEYNQINVEKYSINRVSFPSGIQQKNLLQVNFELQEPIKEGEYSVSVEVFLQDNVLQQLLNNLIRLKKFLNYLETYSSVVFKNLDKLSNSVKTNNPQPDIYYSLVEENFFDFIKAVSDIGIPLDEPISSENFDDKEKTGKKILEELLISLRPENTNLETVYQVMDLVGSVIKEYSKFTDIFSNPAFNPHIETFFNITRSRANVNHKHTFKETIKSSFSEKMFVLTKNEIFEKKFHSNLLFDMSRSYFINGNNFINIIRSDDFEQKVKEVDGSNRILFNNRFDKLLKELSPPQATEELAIDYKGIEKRREIKEQTLQSEKRNVSSEFKREEEKRKNKERTTKEEYELSLREEENREREIYEQNARNEAKSREANIINFIYNITRIPEYLVGFSVTDDPTYGQVINLGNPYWNSSSDNDNLQFGRLVNVEIKKDFFKEFKYSFIIKDYGVKFTNEYFTTN